MSKQVFSLHVTGCLSTLGIRVRFFLQIWLTGFRFNLLPLIELLVTRRLGMTPDAGPGPLLVARARIMQP